MENIEYDLKKELGEKNFLRFINAGGLKFLKKQKTIIYKPTFLQELDLIKSKDFFIYNLMKNKFKDNILFSEANEILLDL
jgi:hypothetical protein